MSAPCGGPRTERGSHGQKAFGCRLGRPAHRALAGYARPRPCALGSFSAPSRTVARRCRSAAFGTIAGSSAAIMGGGSRAIPAASKKFRTYRTTSGFRRSTGQSPLRSMKAVASCGCAWTPRRARLRRTTTSCRYRAPRTSHSNRRGGSMRPTTIPGLVIAIKGVDSPLI